MKVYQKLSAYIRAYKTNQETNNEKWMNYFEEKIKEIAEKYLPNGSGIDNGNYINIEESDENKIVIESSYHKMTNGFYDGWIEYSVVVTPDLLNEIVFEFIEHNGNELEKDYGLKDYLYIAYYSALMDEYEEE